MDIFEKVVDIYQTMSIIKHDDMHIHNTVYTIDYTQYRKEQKL